MLVGGPGAGGVDQVADPGAVEADGAGGRGRAGEAQFGGLDPVEGELLAGAEVELGGGDQAGVVEAGVGEPDPAPGAERGVAGGAVREGVAGLAVAGAVHGAGAGPGAVVGAGQVQGVADGDPRGVQRVRVVGDGAQRGAAQREPAADPGRAEAEFAEQVEAFGLAVLVDGEAVGGDGAPEGVGADGGLVEQQVGADAGVGEADAAGYAAAGEVDVALGGEPGGLQPGEGAGDQPQGAGVGLGDQQFAVEAAELELDVAADAAAGQPEVSGDQRAGELQRGDPAGDGLRPVQQQPGDHLGADGAPGPPLLGGERVVRAVALPVGADGRAGGGGQDQVGAPLGRPGPQVVHVAVAEGLPQAAFGVGPVVRCLLHRVPR